MSTRLAKQIIYATFYVVVWVLVIGAGYRIFVHAPASCFDNQQNQGEQGVDCGGPCAMACTSGAQPISALSVSTFTSSLGHETFLAKVANANSNLAASYFVFSFDLHDLSTGAVLQSIPGTSFLYGNEIKYVVLVNQPVTSGIPGAWSLDIPTSTIQWVATSSFGSAPELAIQNISTQISSSTHGAVGIVLVGGKLVDNDTIPFKKIFIIAVFKDANGNPIGASQTELDSISPNQIENFSVSYPAIAGLNPAATEVQAYAER